MKKPVYLTLLVSALLTLYVNKTFAQNSTPDSTTQHLAFNNATNLFHASLGPMSPLFNGPEYYFYDPLIKGNAYFLEVNAFTPGSVFYDGGHYTNVRILYDLYSDKVAVLLYNNFSKFSLLKEKVRNFDFLGHHFININIDTLPNDKSGIKSGYYDQLYNGKTEVLVKRSKSIQTTSSTAGNESYFSPSRDFYFKKKNIYYNISSQGDLLDVLKDKKKELQQYIKSGQIKFRKDPEEAMVKIATQYDHLTN